MRRIPSIGAAPEMAVRRLAHSIGYRYRLHRKDLPGKPDLVFGPRRKIVFVHGCFWHQHPASSCPIVREPKSNQDYWTAKLRGNRQRDLEHEDALRRLGWETLTLWECEIKDSLQQVERKLREFLG